MVSASLSVAQYKSPHGGCGHWAFHLLVVDGDKTEHIIMQITNTRTASFEFEELNIDPSTSSRYIRSVAIAELDGTSSIDNVKKILSEQEIHNDQLQWSCQDWIMEALESLNVEGEVGDYEYGEAKETLEADYSHF